MVDNRSEWKKTEKFFVVVILLLLVGQILFIQPGIISSQLHQTSPSYKLVKITPEDYQNATLMKEFAIRCNETACYRLERT